MFALHRSKSLPQRKKPYFEFLDDVKAARMKESKVTTKIALTVTRDDLSRPKSKVI